MLALAGCTGLDPTVLYQCETGNTCLQAGYSCWSDGLCHPSLEPPRVDAGADAGGLDGGADDAGLDAGALDGGALPDGGTPCVPATVCPAGVACGFVDAGCGLELHCGRCGPGLECGVATPNACATPRVCGRNGWCFENPLPQGHTIRGAYSADERHTWWVGDDATVLFWDGERHRALDLPVGESVDFFGVHGTSASNVFVVGTQGTVVHWDGASWTVETVPGAPKPDLRAVFVAPSGVAVAVGTGSTLLRRATPSAATWTANAVSGTFTFDDVTLAADGRFTAVGKPGGVVVREQSPGSSSWMAIAGPPLLEARSVWSAPDGGLFVAGASDGGGGVFGSVQRRAASGAWSSVFDAPGALNVVRGRSADDFFAAGEGGAFARVAGGTPSVSLAGDTWSALALFSGSAMTEGAGGQVGRALDAAGSLELLSSGSRDDLNALCGDVSVNVLRAPATSNKGCTGPSCLARFYERARDGGTLWAPAEFTMADTGALVACQQKLNFSWMVGDGTRYAHYVTGPNFWQVENLASQGLPAASYSAVWAESFANLYFAGPSQPAGGTFVAWAHGTPVSPVFTALPYDGGGEVTTTVGGDGVDTFALGTKGLALQLQPDGGFAPPSKLGMMDFTCASGATLADGGTVFVAAGKFGSVWRKANGGAFTEIGPAPASFTAAWVSSEGDAYLVGTDVQSGRTQARVYRRLSKGVLQPVTLVGQFTPSGVFGASQADGGTRLWVVGPGGVILRKDF